MPVFYNSKLVAFMACAAHMADIGGRLDFFEARDLYEEGLRIPPSKLCISGHENEQLFRIIETNVRVPGMVLGDIRAIIGAEKLGLKRLIDFLNDYEGIKHFNALVENILNRSELAMRKALLALPNGTWQYELKADGFREPLQIKTTVSKKGEKISVDFTGSSKQFENASINCVPNCTFADAFYPIKCSLTPDLPNNEGLFRALMVSAPEGSVFNTTFPSPVKSRSKTSFHINVAVYGALAEAMPDRVQAGSGSFWAITLHGTHPDGSVFNVHILPNGGKGATDKMDGLPTIAFPYNGTVTPVEIIENQTPIIVGYKRLITDSGGPGKYRGGLGQEIELRVIGNRPLVASLRPDKVIYPPPGILGGEPGMSGSFDVDGKNVSVEPLSLQPGQIYHLKLPGGGGYGRPEKRELKAILNDVLNGYVSQKAARKNYICWGFTHADSLLLSYNGKRPYFGTNPICVSVPRKGEEPYCLDMATSKISWNKLLNLREKNKKLMDDLASNSKGNVTNNPKLASALMPIGSFKGFGLAPLVEILCSIYSGMDFGRNIKSMYKTPLNVKRKLGQFYMTMKIDGTLNSNTFLKRMQVFSKTVRREPAKKKQKSFFTK